MGEMHWIIRHTQRLQWHRLLPLRLCLIVFTLLAPFSTLSAQESQTAYNFLRLPVSAHAAALGGDNISLVDDDATLIFQNPALINDVSDRTINLNFMTYMEGAKTASAAFLKAAGERGTWGVTAQYMDYGSMKETTADNQELGTFSARDIAIGGTFAYALTNELSGGVTAKFITSYIGSYNSLALGVDLGINYYHEDYDLSLSAVAQRRLRPHPPRPADRCHQTYRPLPAARVGHNEPAQRLERGLRPSLRHRCRRAARTEHLRGRRL